MFSSILVGFIENHVEDARLIKYSTIPRARWSHISQTFFGSFQDKSTKFTSLDSYWVSSYPFEKKFNWREKRGTQSLWRKYTKFVSLKRLKFSQPTTLFPQGYNSVMPRNVKYCRIICKTPCCSWRMECFMLISVWLNTVWSFKYCLLSFSLFISLLFLHYLCSTLKSDIRLVKVIAIATWCLWHWCR